MLAVLPGPVEVDVPVLVAVDEAAWDDDAWEDELVDAPVAPVVVVEPPPEAGRPPSASGWSLPELEEQAPTTTAAMAAGARAAKTRRAMVPILSEPALCCQFFTLTSGSSR